MNWPRGFDYIGGSLARRLGLGRGDGTGMGPEGPKTFERANYREEIPMKRTIFCLLSVLLLMAGCSTAPVATSPEEAAEPTPPSIQGIWTIESMDVGMGENKSTRVPPAFMMFIGKTHYSAIRDFTPEAQPGAPAPARSFMADAGTYEYDGTDLVVYHKVAAFPVLGSMTFGCQLEGPDKMILTPQYDKMVMPGAKIGPTEDGKMGYGDAAVLYRFKRLE